MDQPLKTLIVDDDEGRTLLIQEMLVIDGDETLMGRSAEEASNFPGVHSTNLVVSDLRMPGMVDRAIRQEHVIKAFYEGRVNDFLKFPPYIH